MRISEIEMQGLISGKCIPGDMKVNESLPTYLVRKFSELHLQQEAIEALMLAMRDDARESRSKLELITAECAAFKSGPVGFFAYGTDCGYEVFDTAEKARNFAEEEISHYRDLACDGWSDEVKSVVWGVTMQRATMTGLRPIQPEDGCGDEFEEWCDYTLLPSLNTPATDAMVNDIRAEGLDLYAAEREELCELCIKLSDREMGVANSFAASTARTMAAELRAAAKDGE